MSNVSGTISVNVEFRDTTTSSGVQSLKTITLQESTEYTTGKVAVVSGTVGTSRAALWSADSPVSFGGYKDSAGVNVAFDSINRIALRSSSSSGVTIDEPDGNSFKLVSRNNEVAVCSGSGIGLEIYANSGTASFSVVLIGPKAQA
jgi:hypothetical protein